MKPNKKQIEMAVAKLTVLKFFPAEMIARAVVMGILDRMVGTVEQLDWLVTAMIDRVGEWKGPKELRAVFCTRYRPFDGIEAWSEIPGFTALDSEAAHYFEHENIKKLEKSTPDLGVLVKAHLI